MRGAIFSLLLAPTSCVSYSFQEIYNTLLIDGGGVLLFDRERVCVRACVCAWLGGPLFIDIISCSDSVTS